MFITDSMWKLGLACVLAVIGASAAPDPPILPERLIDGSKTPEQVPDDVAYDLLFRRLLGLRSAGDRYSFRALTQLDEQDDRIFFLAVERYQAALEEIERTDLEIRRSSPRSPSAAQIEAQSRAYGQASRMIHDTMRSFGFDLSAGGRARIKDYLLNHVKRGTSLYIPGSPASEGEGPSNAGSAPSNEEIAAFVTTASQALLVAHVSESEDVTFVELQNSTSAPIVAFRISMCAPELSEQTGMDIAPDGRELIAPNSSYQLGISKRNRPGCAQYTPKASAVLFLDGTALGLRHEIEEMKFKRLGYLVETERIARILESSEDEPDVPAALAAIGDCPYGRPAVVRHAFEGVLSGADAAAAASAREEATEALYSGLWSARWFARSNVAYVAEDGSGAEGSAVRWKRLVGQFRARRMAAEQHRKLAGARLYR